jgi:glycosyltransferase involved in cell wall biosynthesis
MIYADHRRIGDHGIGRFAREVLAGLDYRPVPLKTDPDSPLDPLRLAQFLRPLKAGDIFFSPGYNPPLHCPVPFLFTLHDLNHLDRVENSSPLKRLYYSAIVKPACYKADFVVTVSEFSRGRIIEWSGISPDKVRNVGNGVSPQFTADGPGYQMPFPYILCVSSTGKKHKNGVGQVEAFAKSGLASEIHMVFTGAPSIDIEDSLQRNRLTGSVHFLGSVPDEQLPSLYRGAQALSFTSLYEGFGLPVVEAMACGTPVVTSNTTSLPEVVGDAALLVDPTSVEETAAALQRVIHDSTLREQLRARGLIQARKHSWVNTAAQVRDLVDSVAAKTRSRN